jgi:ABC-type lipoprotein release transport system permease subunit
MRQLFKMAYRDLGRNRRRSLFSALGLGIGLALLLWMAAFIQGEVDGSSESAIKLESGHLQVRAASYDESKTSLDFTDLIADPAALASKIAGIPQVAVATPRLYANGIISSGDQSLGVRVIGIDPASAANAPYSSSLVGGAFLTADDSSGILIGQALADKVGVKAGESLVLDINTSNGTVDEQSFTVRGIFSSGVLGYDQTTVLLPLAKAQTFAQTPNHASAIFILLHDRADSAAVAASIQSTQYQVLTFEQMNTLLVQFEDLSNSYMWMLYLIVLAITVTVIVNTLVMSVFERTREIGILAAIGMRGGRIMTLFFAESGMLAIGGIAIGLVLGGLLVAYTTIYGFTLPNFGLTGIAQNNVIYTHLTLKDTITLSLMALGVTLVAALYPARLAAGMEVVDALHGGK